MSKHAEITQFMQQLAERLPEMSCNAWISYSTQMGHAAYGDEFLKWFERGGATVG